MADVEDGTPVMSNGVVSSVDIDSLECLSTVQASAFNTSSQSLKSDLKILSESQVQNNTSSSSTFNTHQHNSNHLTDSSPLFSSAGQEAQNQSKVDGNGEMSLQELIEAELTSRFATESNEDSLAPDSLENILDEPYEPVHTTEVTKMNGHVITSSTVMDSLEVDLDNSPFSLDSLSDFSRSGVNIQENGITNGHIVEESSVKNVSNNIEKMPNGVVITPNVDFVSSLEFIAPPTPTVTKVENIHQEEKIEVGEIQVHECNILETEPIASNVISIETHSVESHLETAEVIENNILDLDHQSDIEVVEVVEEIQNGHCDDVEVGQQKGHCTPETNGDFSHVDAAQIEAIINATKSYKMIDVVDEGVHESNGSNLLSAVNVTNSKGAKLNGEMENGGEDDGADDAWPDEESKPKQLDEFERMEQEVMKEMEENKKNEEEKKKKKRRDGKDGDKKGKKKKKRGDSEKENKKANLERDILAKHVGPRVRSFDAAKMKSKFQKPKESNPVSPECRICNKIVFQMEKIVAEKASWHKNCFRCSECQKNLTLETYQSNDGILYCKPHFKNLFKPKAVVQDEAEERKERQMRRPKLIVLESQPEILPEDVVRATSKPDYGLEELQQMNVKQRFAKFELLNQEEERPPILEPVKRSRSLMSKAARFLEGGDDRPYGVDNDELGEFEEEEEDEEYEDEEEEEEEGEDGQIIIKSRKKKERPMSFSGMGDLKSAWEQKQRREEMSNARKEEISKFRMMLCAGKNMSLKEKFESGNFDEEDERDQFKSEIVIEGSNKASNLRARFEQGEPFILEEDGEVTKSSMVGSEIQEVEEVFREAETAKKARNVFRKIDSHVASEGAPVMRSSSFAANPANRLSMDVSYMKCLNSPPVTGEVVKSTDNKDDSDVEPDDLSSKFNFFATFEDREKKEKEKKRKVFRITPPREDTDVKGVSTGDEADVWGRDPNLIRASDNYEDDVDCRNTKNILNMFKKMEMGEEEDGEDAPRPLKRFTPPPEDGCDYSSSEYTDSDGSYTDDDDYEDEEEEDEETEDGDFKSKFKDELLDMSAKKAGQIRAKFEKWEANQKSEKTEEVLGDDEECRPSIDTARNLKAIFENKMAEDAKVHTSKQRTKVSRFVGGGGDVCVACTKTVYVMEKLEVHGKIMHKNCFKCFKCNTPLRIGAFSFDGVHLYCITHYKQMFTEKGSYDAFAGDSGKWSNKIQISSMNGDLKSQE